MVPEKDVVRLGASSVFISSSGVSGEAVRTEVITPEPHCSAGWSLLFYLSLLLSSSDSSEPVQQCTW